MYQIVSKDIFVQFLDEIFSYMHHIAQVFGTECLLDTVYIIVNNLHVHLGGF